MADDCDGVECYEDGVTSGHLPFDGTDEFRERYYMGSEQILKTEESFPDEDSKITRFAQEVLAPGSTR